MKQFSKAQLVKSRDRLRELAAAAAKHVGALRVEREAVALLITADPQRTPAAVRGKSWEIRRAHHAVENGRLAERVTTTKAKVAEHIAEAATLTAGPLAARNALQKEADDRRVSREQLLTEQWLQSGPRFHPPYTPKKIEHIPGDHRPMIGDPLVNAMTNAQEIDRWQRGELIEEMRHGRVAAELQIATAAELVRRAADAAATGDGQLLNAIDRQHKHRIESGRYPAGEGGLRAQVTAALTKAVEAIPLPEEWAEQLTLLDEIADADAALRNARREIETGKQSNDETSRLVSQLGGQQGYNEQRHQAADAEQQAASARAERMLSGVPDETPAPAPQ